MRIAFFVPSLAGMGPVILVRDLVRSLKELGAEITVFYFTEKNEVNFDCATKRISFWQKINFDEFDVLHSHGLRPDAYLHIHRSGRRSKKISTVHIYMYEDLKFTYGPITARLVPFIWRKFLASKDRIVTLSKDMTSYYKNLGLVESKLIHAYNGRSIQVSNEVQIHSQEIFLYCGNSSSLIPSGR